ncbi:integrase core domain-containing protein [Streptomyces sp. NPDC054770]
MTIRRHGFGAAAEQAGCVGPIPGLSGIFEVERCAGFGLLTRRHARYGVERLGPGRKVPVALRDQFCSPRRTVHPTAQRAAQQARNLAADLGAHIESLRFALRDRDSEYTGSFDAVFAAEEMEVLLSTPQAPRMNAHCERVIGTIRREALDHVLIMNEGHARQILAEYQHHYNRHRPHRARDQRPPEAQDQPAAGNDPHAQRLLRTSVLGGVIHEYRYAA